MLTEMIIPSFLQKYENNNDHNSNRNRNRNRKNKNDYSIIKDQQDEMRNSFNNDTYKNKYFQYRIKKRTSKVNFCNSGSMFFDYLCTSQANAIHNRTNHVWKEELMGRRKNDRKKKKVFQQHKKYVTVLTTPSPSTSAYEYYDCPWDPHDFAEEENFFLQDQNQNQSQILDCHTEKLDIALSSNDFFYTEWVYLLNSLVISLPFSLYRGRILKVLFKIFIERLNSSNAGNYMELISVSK